MNRTASTDSTPGCGESKAALAGPGEVLVSRTVTDLVAGSGLASRDRGEHSLKGVAWRLASPRSQHVIRCATGSYVHLTPEAQVTDTGGRRPMTEQGYLGT